MNAAEFVNSWKQERDKMLRSYLSSPDTQVGIMLRSLNLTPDQQSKLETALGLILTAAYYTLLLGLDGCTTIGKTQMPYTILDERGNRISNPGELEAEAYRYFQESS